MWLDRLKKMKEESGLSIKAIAHLSKIPEPTLEKIFSGQTKDPKFDTMRQLVHFFGHSLDDLVDDEYTAKKSSPFYIELDGLDQDDKTILPMLKNITPDQKKMMIALLKITVEQNQ